MRDTINKTLIKAKNYKTLIQNFSYLSALQVFNLILPLITYPYLIRVLGKETYGLVVFAQSIVGYLVILVGFGFNISATCDISIHRDNKEKLSEIVSSVFILKSILFFISCLIMIFLLVFIPEARGYKTLFLLSLWACLYDVIFPIWYFQGIEQMKYITYISLTSRLIFLGLIFVLIHKPTDYLFVPIIYSIGSLVAGSIALFLIFQKHKIRFVWQPYQKLKYYFIDSLPLFVSSLSFSLYASTNKVVTGLFLGLTEVSYYDLAEKLTALMKLPQTLIGQSLFPKISKERNLKFVRSIFKFEIIANLILYLLFILFAENIIKLIGGSQMLPALPVVLILAITVPIIAMSNVFGLQLLISFGLKKIFSRIIVIMSFIYILAILIFWLIDGFSIVGISISTVLTELFGALLMFYYCKKHNLWE